MAIQARLIGRLGGGAEVTSVPVSASGVSSSGATLHTVTVPDGERWLIVCTGAGGASSMEALITMDGRTLRTESSGAGKPLDIAATIVGLASVPITVKSGGILPITYTGHVHTVPLPD